MSPKESNSSFQHDVVSDGKGHNSEGGLVAGNPTIQDVADVCGVSNMTVSRVFSGSGAVAEKTEQRVLQAAKKLGYRPNIAARTMRGGKTKTIGILGGSFITAVAMPKLRAIEEAARQAGYVCYINYMPWDDADAIQTAIDDLVSRSVDGLIVYVGSPPHRLVEKKLAHIDVPMVFLDGAPKDARCRIDIDRYSGMVQAAQHLATLGHKQVRFVSTTSDVYDPTLRADLYRRALDEAGIEMLSPWEYTLDPNMDVMASAYQLVEQMIAAGDLPTALMMNNDEGALAALMALRQAGVAVPDDISVLGFDDLKFAAYCHPALTTIHQPRQEVGAAAFEMLQKVMKADSTFENPDPMQQTFNCQLIIRGSTGRAGSGHQENVGQVLTCQKILN